MSREESISLTPSEAEKFASIYESYHRHVYAYCRRRADIDQVDDLASEVFLTLWRKIETAPTGEDALKWLYQVAHLVLNNHWRGSNRKKRLEDKLQSISLDPTPLVHDQIAVREEVRQVLEAASRLRPRDLEILRLTFWEELSLDDIAEILGIKANAAKQRLHRAKKSLIKEYQRTSRQETASPAAQKGGEW